MLYKVVASLLVLSYLLVNQELDGPRVLVICGAEQPDAVLEEGISGSFAKIGGGGGLNNLLVAALNGAVTIVQVNDISSSISQTLDFDVAGVLH